MFCRSCGTRVEDGQRYCGVCGSPSQPPTPIPTQAQQTPSPEAPAPQTDAPAEVPPAAPSLGAIRGPTIIVAIVALGVLIWPVINFARTRATAAPARLATTPAPVLPTGPVTCESTHGYHLKVPGTWDADTPDNLNCTYFAVKLPDPQGGQASLRAYPRSGDFDDLKVDGTLISESKGKIRGRNADRYEVNYTDDQGRWRAYGFKLEHEEQAYVFALVFREHLALDDRTKAIFDEVVRQIRF